MGYADWNDEQPDPCFRCGCETHRTEFVSPTNKLPTRYRAQSCSRCGILTDPHWLDGAWMGRWVEAGSPDNLYDFRLRTAKRLREEWDAKK